MIDNVISGGYLSPMREDRYSGTTLPSPVHKLFRMAEREADRAHPERLRRLSDSSEGELAVSREARLIDSKNPRVVKAKLLGLLHQHRAEWDAFIGSLPNRSWVGEIVGQP
jgi:hypothetical protein